MGRGRIKTHFNHCNTHTLQSHQSLALERRDDCKDTVGLLVAALLPGLFLRYYGVRAGKEPLNQFSSHQAVQANWSTMWRHREKGPDWRRK